MTNRALRPAGIAATAAALLAAAACGSTAQPPAPATTGVPASAGSPSAASAPSVAALPIPGSIPDSAFLAAVDVPGKAKDGPHRLGAGDQPLPEFCDTPYEHEDRIGVRGTRSLAFVSDGSPADSVPKAMTFQDILVFRGDGAEVFLDDLTAAVRSCPAGDRGRKNHLRGEIGAGDESVLIEQTTPAFGDDGEPVGNGSLHSLYWTAVRVGDAIAFVSNTGWESGSAERADTEHLGRRAAARLADWRGR
jgi:hypothetical protein